MTGSGRRLLTSGGCGAMLKTFCKQLGGPCDEYWVYTGLPSSIGVVQS
jgi:hypothetical protein